MHKRTVYKAPPEADDEVVPDLPTPPAEYFDEVWDATNEAVDLLLSKLVDDGTPVKGLVEVDKASKQLVALLHPIAQRHAAVLTEEQKRAIEVHLAGRTAHVERILVD